jgi:hypothetical protein
MLAGEPFKCFVGPQLEKPWQVGFASQHSLAVHWAAPQVIDGAFDFKKCVDPQLEKPWHVGFGEADNSGVAVGQPLGGQLSPGQSTMPGTHDDVPPRRKDMPVLLLSS